MKQIYFLIIFILFISIYSFAGAPVIKARSNGNWNTSSTWDLNRVPVNGDSIVIPATKTVAIDDMEFLNNVFIKVQGTLQFKNSYSWLCLNSTSTVVVNTNARIDGTQAGLQFISIGLSTVFSGTDITGPKVASYSTGNSFLTFTEIPLPVKFISFTLAHQNNNVLVEWATSEEINASVYELQRSVDGGNWNTITTVTAAGNANNTNRYAYTDKNVTSTTVYYRIKQVDIDGKFTYTIIKSVQVKSKNSTISIIAASNKVTIQFSEQVTGKVELTMFTLNGQVVTKQAVISPLGQVVLNTNAALQGNYVVTIQNGQNMITSKQIIL